MARATKEESEQTARSVLEAAAGLFATRGYASVGLEEVAAAAGVTRGAVYHHYRSKHGVFAAVADRAQQQVAAAVLASTEGADSDWDGLLAGCRAFLVAALDDDVRQVLLVDAPAVLGWSAWRHQDARASGRHLEEALSSLATKGVVHVQSTAGAAALLSGAMNEAALHVAESPDPDAALEAVQLDLARMLEALRRAR